MILPADFLDFALNIYFCDFGHSLAPVHHTFTLAVGYLVQRFGIMSSTSWLMLKAWRSFSSATDIANFDTLFERV